MSTAAPRAAALLCAALLAACTTLRIPVRAPDFAAGDLVRATVEDVTLEAHAVEGTAAYHDLFDDDLPEIGVAAVWVSVRNGRSAPIDLAPAQWRIVAGERQYPSVGRDDLLKRFYKGRKIRLYSQRAHEDTRSALERVLFRGGTLEPGGAAAGLLFVRIEPVRDARWARGATLVLRGIRIDGGRQIEVPVRLGPDAEQHARP